MILPHYLDSKIDIFTTPNIVLFILSPNLLAPFLFFKNPALRYIIELLIFFKI